MSLYGLLGAVMLAIGVPVGAFAQTKAEGQPSRVIPEPHGQGEQAWRRLPPEQREQIRNRFREERQRQLDNAGPSGAPRDVGANRRLTPEERRVLRSEISEVHGNRFEGEGRPSRGERSGRAQRK